MFSSRGCNMDQRLNCICHSIQFCAIWKRRLCLLCACITLFFFSNFKLYILYRGIAHEQCCSSLRPTAKGLSPSQHMYPSSPKPPCALGWHTALSRVPCAISRSLLVPHFEYSKCNSKFSHLQAKFLPSLGGWVHKSVTRCVHHAWSVGQTSPDDCFFFFL